MRFSCTSLGEIGDSGQDGRQGMWRLCIEDDQQNRTVVNLVRKTYTIGRAEDNGIRLTDRNISRAHAVLEREDDEWRLTDLGSLTGCIVNDRRIEGSAVLEHGDKVRFGDYLVTLTDESQQDETVRARAVGYSDDSADKTTEYYPERNDRLVVIEGPNVGAQYPLSKSRLLLGRGEECDIALNDTSVSRVHADIEYVDDEQYRISDQNSSNGLRINGEEKKSAVLDTGDVIELGDVFLKFVPKGLSFEVDAAALNPRGSATTAQRLTSNPRVLAGTALAGLVLGLAVFGSFGRGESDGVDSSPEAAAVAEAGRLFSAGQLEQAHARLAVVPASSHLRDATLFRRIVAAWADAQFENARHAESETEERRLLTLVASAENVDSVRREKAVHRLQQLNAANVEPQDLPKAAETPDAGLEAPMPLPIEAGGPQPTAALSRPAPRKPIARRPRPAKRSPPQQDTETPATVTVPAAPPPPVNSGNRTVPPIVRENPNAPIAKPPTVTAPSPNAEVQSAPPVPVTPGGE